ncbi:hypothetical protein BCON_0177g00060 [Botryotinia convoluta]|uniref:Uncharacterized protein n=1 Tax=Botryotinia convoluta TaxID=54673 RepID=A0A4Z1HPR7_9HELO|nr:hypothetical protein BCON_0177g00060 [Botryotinia convoluta]
MSPDIPSKQLLETHSQAIFAELLYPGTIATKIGCIDSSVDSAVEHYMPDIENSTQNRVSWMPSVVGARQEKGTFTGLKKLRNVNGE